MYRLTDSGAIARIADGAFIPADPANSDYAGFLAWKAEGNTPAPVPAPVFNQQAALARLRVVRRPILDALSGLLADALTDADQPLVAALRSARQGLKDLPSDTQLLAATDDKDFDYIAHERYKALAAALPSSARTAFKDALL